MTTDDQSHRLILQRIAHRVMLERGLLPDFSTAALDELARLHAPAKTQTGQDPRGMRDLRSLLWASIDNDDSRDLDQLSVAEAMPGDKIKVLVAIADVGSSIMDGSALDQHARHNTTSVYTAAEIFPMLPEKVSTDITSLNFEEDRLSIVVEMLVGVDGSLEGSSIYRAWVHNHAKLAYNSVAAWLEKGAAIPEAIRAVTGLAENLQLQDRAAQRMKNFRHVHGALSLETIEARPVFDGDQISALEVEEKNRAKEIIEDFMIAANGVTARYLSSSQFPSIRRVVRTPRRWDRIVAIAADHKFSLPELPDSKALEQFLVGQKAADPLRFPDLSLSVIKLLGSGEYVAEPPDGNVPGHFGLAVKDYAHSTAPNRRYPDLLTPAPGESRPGRPVCALQHQGSGSAGRPLHRGGRCRQQGRTPGWQIRRGAAARIEARRTVRFDRHGRIPKRHLGAVAQPAGGRKAGGWLRRVGRRRPGAGAVDRNQRYAGIYRFQESRLFQASLTQTEKATRNGLFFWTGRL